MLRSFPYWARAAALALTCQLSFIASWGHAAYPRVGGRGALKFDGDNDYVTLGNNPSLRLSGDLTVSAWVKLGPNTAGQHLGILGKMTVRSAYPLGFRLARVDKNRFRFAIGGPYALRELPSTMTYTDSEWHHVAGTMRG